MKLKDLRKIFTVNTNVKLVLNGNVNVFEGPWKNVPAEYEDYLVDLIIPIRHPYNDNLGEASILIYREDKE